MAKKICLKCGEEKGTAGYISVRSPLHNGQLPICRTCLAKMIEENKGEDGSTWNFVDKVCQWANIPFVPEEWEKIYEKDGGGAFGIYVSIFRNKEYESLNWNDYNRAYLKLKEENRVEDALPEMQEDYFNKLRAKWGHQYDDEDLEYLENLHQGILNSQNIVGALNEDQAMKLCKISLIIEEKIRAGQDISKDLKAYSDLSEQANLTTKTIKNADDFSSVGEVFSFLEKRGWKNEYYDEITRDEIDYTIKDIKNWLRYLYVNETGVAEEIEARIESLKSVDSANGYQFDEKDFRDYMAQQDGAVEDDEFDPSL